jgi:signal transduction histidine kinase
MIEPAGNEPPPLRAAEIANTRKAVAQEALALLQQLASRLTDPNVASRVRVLADSLEAADRGRRALEQQMHDGVLQELTVILVATHALEGTDFAPLGADRKEEVEELVKAASDTAQLASRKIKELLVALGSDPGGPPFGS